MKPTDVKNSHWLLFNLYFWIEHFIGLKLSQKWLSPFRERLYSNILESLKNINRGGIVQIETIDLEKDDFPSIDNLNQRPYLFKGAARKWSCIEKWDENFFINELGDYTLNISYDLGFNDQDKVKLNAKLGTYIQKLKNNKSEYLRFCRIIDEKPALKKDLDLEFLSRFKQSDDLEEFYFFMGDENTHTGLHCEVTESIGVQIVGKKKWILIAPEERIFIYPIAKRYNHFLTHLNPENFDPQQFPLFPYAKRYEVDLEPGDVLWFPAFYWHYVRNLSPSIGIAYKSLHLKNAVRKSKILTVLFFLRTHPSVVNPFPILKKIFFGK